MRTLDDKCFNTENLSFDARNHSFNVGIAKDFSPIMALWLAHLAFWSEKNLANNTNIHDGLVWCYDTIEAIGDYFPYLTKSQRETMINNSVKHGLVVTGNYNHTTYDRTVWYALTPKAYFYFPHLVDEKYIKRLFFSISEKSEMDLREFGNGFPGFRMTIPDADPDTDPDKKSVGESATQPTIKKFPTPKERNEAAAYDCEKVKKIFAIKFDGLNINYEALFNECKDYYTSKRQWVTAKKWKAWVEREKIENYTKSTKTSQNETKPQNSYFSAEEQVLLADIKAGIRLGKPDMLFSASPERFKLAQDVLAKEQELIKSWKDSYQNLPKNNARKSSLTSALNLVSHLNSSLQGS